MPAHVGVDENEEVDLHIGKHETGYCDKSRDHITVQHILLDCVAYDRERQQLIQELNQLEIDSMSVKVLLGNRSRQ